MSCDCISLTDRIKPILHPCSTQRLLWVRSFLRRSVHIKNNRAAHWNCLIEIHVSTMNTSVYHQQYTVCILEFCTKRYLVYKNTVHNSYTWDTHVHVWMQDFKCQESVRAPPPSRTQNTNTHNWHQLNRWITIAGIRSVTINENVLWLINTLRPRPAGVTARRQTTGGGVEMYISLFCFELPVGPWNTIK